MIKKTIMVKLLWLIPVALFGFLFFISPRELQTKASDEGRKEYQVSTYQELKTALSDITAESDVRITVTNSIADITEPLVIRGKTEIIASVPVTLTLESTFIDIKNGSEAIFRDLNIVQHNSGGSASQAVLFRDNLKQGNAYFYHCNITAESSAVLKSSSVNGRFFLDDTTVTGGEYSFYKGSMFLSGTTTFSSQVEATTFVYDFRNSEVLASPDPESFQTSDRVTLSVNQKPEYYRGSNTETEKLDMKVYYTFDESDPLTSATRMEFTQPFSLIVDRKVKAVMVSKLYDNIYSGKIYEFTYDVNPDKTPGTLQSVETFPEISLRCQSKISDMTLPEAVNITLADGRNLYALVSWDTSKFNTAAEGTFVLEGELDLPYFVSDSKNLKALYPVKVYYNEIEDFAFTQYKPMQEGKNTAYTGYHVGYFTARGGNESSYQFSFVNDDNGADNDRFVLEDDTLFIKKSLPAGDYYIHVKAESGNKTADLTLTLTVLGKGKVVKVISNPYANINWDTVNFVKTATHNHTFYSNGSFEESEWKDSAFDTVDERVQRYKDMGYGAVIITDHDYVALEKVGGNYTDSGILKIYGNEMSKAYHTLYYGFGPYYDNKGAGTSVSNGMEGNIKNIQNMEDGIVYFAHPNRSSTDKDYWLNLFNKYSVVYGMEVFNAGQAKVNYSEDIWDYILTKSMPDRPIYGSGSDDAHSNSAAGTGWTVLLLRDEEMNSEGIMNALKNGNSFIGSICVDPETDDGIMWDTVKGPVPQIQRINVDNEKGTITVTASDYYTIEWVSSDGKVVGTGETIDLNANYGISKYIRVRIYGDNGMIHSQPFGLAFGEEDYEGIPEVKDPEPKPDPDPDPDPTPEPIKKQGCFSLISPTAGIVFALSAVTLGTYRIIRSRKKKSQDPE